MSNEDKLVEDLYDSAAETYLDIVKRTNYIGPQWLLENLQDNFQTNELKILDLGCANGINIANLSKLNPSTVVTGVDISKQMIAEAQKTGLYKSLYHQCIDPKTSLSIR